MSEILATNLIVSGPPNRPPTQIPTTCAKTSKGGIPVMYIVPTVQSVQ